jgi:ribosome-binding ATPase YchF (GTP1/OBG family)
MSIVCHLDVPDTSSTCSTDTNIQIEHLITKFLAQALTRAAYASLGLQTFFTSGPTETKAWTISKGMTAPQVLTYLSDFILSNE